MRELIVIGGFVRARRGTHNLLRYPADERSVGGHTGGHDTDTDLERRNIQGANLIPGRVC